VAVAVRRHAFDPVRVGRAECDAWAAYYRRDWLRVLVGIWAMVRYGFALGPVRNLRGAWYVLRANQAWAPLTDNDPESARRYMARFYRLANEARRVRVDPFRAATLEIAWWRVHRQRQRENAPRADLEARLADLYAYVHHAAAEDVRLPARLRAEAADLSDAWVAAGRRMDDPTLARERQALVASYAALREATEPT
jgi:hypothetical protein